MLKSFSDLTTFCAAKGYSSFTDLQKLAFACDSFYSQKDVFIIGETSSGKTLIAQMAIAMQKKKKTLYMVPYRALARQKVKEMKEFFGESIDIIISTGEYRENDVYVLNAQADIVVIIYEKAFLFAAINPQFLGLYDVIIFDEFGLVDDDERGIKADLLFAWSRNFSNLRSVVLATPNYDWSLYANPERFLIYYSESRPIKIKKVDLIRKKTYEYMDGIERPKLKSRIDVRGDKPIVLFDDIPGRVEDILVHICTFHKKLDHKILIFENDRTGIIEKAKILYYKLIDVSVLVEPDQETVEKLKSATLKKMQIPEENLFLVFDDFCFEMMAAGISFHSAALPFELRHEIENQFLNDDEVLSIVFATETLAFGLNSGVDVVIIASIFKPNGTGSSITLNKNEYRNYMGRAGRLGYSNLGYTYTIIPNNRLDLWDRLLLSDIEKIESKLFNKDIKHAAMYLLSLVPRKPSNITVERLIKELSSLCYNSSNYEFINSFFMTVEGQCSMLEERALVETDDSSFEKAYCITDKGAKLQGYIIDIDTYDLLEKSSGLFSAKNMFYFDYIYQISSCKSLIESNDIYFTSKHLNERKLMTNHYFTSLENRIRQDNHISSNLLNTLRKKHYNRDFSESSRSKPGDYQEDTRLRIAIVLYHRIMDTPIQEIGSVCSIGYAGMKNLGEQASYYTDIVRAICDDARVNKEVDDKLEMLSVSLFYQLHLNALGLCDIKSIGAENYKKIGLLVECVELAKQILLNSKDPWRPLKKESLKKTLTYYQTIKRKYLRRGTVSILISNFTDLKKEPVGAPYLPPAIVENIQKRMNIKELTPLQKQAFNTNSFWDDMNIIIRGATSSGKTLIAEIAAARCIHRSERSKNVIYLVPLKAMVSEKYDQFKQDMSGDNYDWDICASSADYQNFDEDILEGNFDIAVIVYEKFFAFLAQKGNDQFLRRCGLVIVDEVQMLSEIDRGAKLEFSITKLLKDYNNVRIMGLTTIYCDTAELEKWLKAELISNPERTCELHEYIVMTNGSYNAKFRSKDDETVSNDVDGVISQYAGQPQLRRKPNERKTEMILALIKQEINQGTNDNPVKIIVFAHSKKVTERLAQDISLSGILPEKRIDHSLRSILGQQDDDEVISKMTNLMQRGIAYHNASLPQGIRKLVEDEFESVNGSIQVIVATATLAIGLNLPADVIILYDHTVKKDGVLRDIEAHTYKNYIGRAGRLGLTTRAGKSYLITDSAGESNGCWDRYVNATPKEIESVFSTLNAHDLAPYYLNYISGSSVGTIVAPDLHEFSAFTFGHNKSKNQDSLGSVDNSVLIPA